MKYTRLFLVRHGETDFNRKGMMQGRGIDAPLNDIGIKQAELVASTLEPEGAEKVIASSMQRAIQTAQPLSDRISRTVHTYRDLDEMDFGDLEGKRSADIQRELNDLHQTWVAGNITQTIPGGESPQQVFDRADSCIRGILNDDGPQTKVLFLHGRLIRILLSKWLGYGLENMHKIEHQNGAINHIMKNHVSFNVVYLNRTDHLTTESLTG